MVNSESPKAGDVKVLERKRKRYAIIEGNLLEYPIFSMERKRVNSTCSQYVWAQRDRKGTVVREEKLSIECTRGLPNAFDLDVFNAVMRLYTKGKGEDEYRKNEVHFTVYQIPKELDLSITGTKRRRIKESLVRMASTVLNFEKSFYAEKEKVTKVVHLIDNLEYYEKWKGKRLINAVKVTLDSELVSSIERNYFKLIDFDIYKSLPSGLPRRLYEYLEKKKYRKTQFEIGVRKLAKRIPLKTRKISQVKELLGRANEELKKKDVIDRWAYKGSNIIYYFKKSERFKEVERDLFHLENLVRTFYESLGQVRVAEELVREGMAVLQGMVDEGYNSDEVEYALGWAVDNVKGIHSVRILPKIIGQALGDKESRKLVEEREEIEKKKRAEEGKRIEADRERADELGRRFKRLRKGEREEIEKTARENLLKQGVKPEFMLEGLVRMERNKIMEERRLKTVSPETAGNGKRGGQREANSDHRAR